MTFNIYVRSYNRYDRIETGRTLEYCTYVVRASQAEAYRKLGIESVWGIEDSLVNSGEKVLNYLIDHAPEDVIAVLDDDIELFRYRHETFENINDPVIVTREIERLAQLITDLNIGYASTAGHTNLMYYDEPFKFVGVNGGLKIFNRKCVKGRFDGTYRFLSDDYFELQELLHNRIILLSEYFIHAGKINTNAGGNNDNKSIQEFESNHARLKEKWGKYYKLPVNSASGGFKVKRR